MVGDGVAKLVERGLTARGAGLDRLPARVARFMELYEPNAARLTRPYALVAETLESLRQRGLRLAVVTNKPHAATMRILGALDLARFFDAVVGGDTLGRRKPDPAPLLHAMRALDAAPAETLMVGDNHHDVAAARAAGVPVAVVAYGYARKPAGGAGRGSGARQLRGGAPARGWSESRDDQVPSADAVQPASASRRSRLTSAFFRPDRAGTWKE